jgi:uncharacterized protein involved in exopolysaccharide biosynthesis
MTFRDMLVFLFKWRRLLSGLTATVFVSVTVLSYVLDQSYLGETKVVIESNRAPTMREMIAPSGELLVELLTTEAEIVQSRTVMAKVVEELHPENRPRKKPSPVSQVVNYLSDTAAEWGLTDKVDPQEAWIARLMKQVKAKPIANSGVFRIRYVDDDPEWAAQIVNAATRHYIEQHLTVYAPRGGTELLKQQMETAENNLAAARQALRDYKQQSGLPALSEQKHELVRSNLSFKDQLVKANNDLAQLRMRYAPSHEKVKLMEQQVARLETVMRTQKGELDRLEHEDSVVNAYISVIGVAESSLNSLRHRYNEAKSNETTTTEMLNVRVIEYATPPKKPTNPRAFLIGVSLPIGLVLALGLALLFEYFDRRIEDQRTAQNLLGLPSLGYVPYLPRTRLTQLVGGPS